MTTNPNAVPPPCKICGSPVRLRKIPMERRLGEAQAKLIDVRRCSSSACPSNTGTRRLGSEI